MKTLSAALAALSLAFVASSASAAPVSVSVSFSQTPVDGFYGDLVASLAVPFSDAHSFTLSATTRLSGQVSTTIIDAPDATTPYLDIRSAYLVYGLNSTRYDLTQTTGFSWIGRDTGTEVWTLSPVDLAPGEYTLYVAGNALNDKGSDGFDANFAGAAAELPEPTALALVATALAALSMSRRRRVG